MSRRRFEQNDTLLRGNAIIHRELPLPVCGRYILVPVKNNE